MNGAGAAPAALEVAALRCERGPTVLFEALTFSLNPGEALLVLGANGSGKTSLLRILAGVSSPAAGRVTWRGVPYTRDAASLRRERLYLGHTVPLKEELTVAENLAHQLALDGLAVPREGLLAALAQFGLLERRDVPARHLSLGQRRRLGLARVSRAQRTLWLLDEPATGLDAIGVSLLEGLLAEHLGQGGMAVLTSHQSIDLPPPIHSLTL